MQQIQDFRSECEALGEMSFFFFFFTPFFDLLIKMPTEDKAAGRRAEESWLLANIMGTRPAGREVIKLHSTMASPLVNSSRGVFAS